MIPVSPDIVVMVNGKTGNGSIAATVQSPVCGAHRRGHAMMLLYHFPHLGTWFDYKLQTVFTYIESHRASSGDTTEAGSSFVKAHMPSKILNVLKVDGEEVRRGEVVMVLESMKMEMVMSASKAGRF